MADKNDDIKHLFEHLGLDPTDYQEIKGPTKVVESARRWSLLGEVSEHPPRAAEIPEERRQVVAQLSAANRAQRIATIRNDEVSQRPSADRTPEPAEDRGEVDALRRASSPGRLPPTVTWATDDQDLDETSSDSESRVESGFGDQHAPEEANDQRRRLVVEADDTDDSEVTEYGQVDDDSADRESREGQQTHCAADVDDSEPDEAAAEAAARTARRADEDAEEAAAARAVRDAAEARAARHRQATKADRNAGDESAADINLLGDFAESIGAPPEPVAVTSARDAEPRRKPQPKAAPSRVSSRKLESEPHEAPARGRDVGAAATESTSRTGAAIQGLLAATQKVKPTPTVSRARARSVEEPPAPTRPTAQRRGDHTEVDRALETPEQTAPTPGETRQAPVADAPGQERRQHGREDFESAIEAVAQAAKAEVRRRVEDERKQSAAREVLTDDEDLDAQIDTAADERLDPVAQEDASAPKRIAASAAPTKSGRDQPSLRSGLPVGNGPASPQQAAPRVERPRDEAEASAANVRDGERLSGSAATRRGPEPREQTATASRERALPASGRAGPSPLRKLREAQAVELPRGDEAAVEDHAARKGRLTDTFRRLQTPEKPAISANGKLRLNYGVRGGVQAVRTAQPETINEVFDRLRRNRRPGEPRK